MDFISLEHKENKYIYGLSNNDLAEHYKLDKGNLSKFMSGERSSCNGYIKKHNVKVLNSRYDTLVFTYKTKCNIDNTLLKTLEEAKEEARFNNALYPIRFYKYHFMVKSKSFGMYKVTFLYKNSIQISINETMINYKVLAKCFYTMTLEEIYFLLTEITIALFNLDFRYFNVSKIDKAIDIKFPYKRLKYFIDNFSDKVKPFVSSAKVQIYKEKKGSSCMVTCGAVQMIFYEKVLETQNNKDLEKQEIFSKIFGFDIKNALEVQEYLDSEYQIIRWEYRLNNKTKILNAYDIDVYKVFFMSEYIDCIIKMFLDKHTTVDFEEMRIIQSILHSDMNINKIDILQDKIIFEKLENCLKVLSSYVSSVHSMYEVIARNESSIDFIGKYIVERLKEPQFNYYNKLDEKRKKLQEGIL